MLNSIIRSIVTATLNFFRKIFSEWLKIKKEEKEIEKIDKDFKVSGDNPNDVFDDNRFNERGGDNG